MRMSLEKQELEVCKKCKLYCNEIGQVNAIGVKKSYCCECYSEIDLSFGLERWCSACLDTYNIREFG